MSTDASNEKAAPPRNRPLSWLKPNPSDKLDSASSELAEKSTSPDLRIAAPVEAEADPKPVSFFTLFRSVIASFRPPIGDLDIIRRRFSTRREITFNVLALFAAVAAGAAQVGA